jgi:hypothetical protein
VTGEGLDEWANWLDEMNLQTAPWRRNFEDQEQRRMHDA